MSDTNDGLSGLGDSFTETTSQSWFSRIGDSIKGLLFGLLLIAGASFLLFWNEGRAVQTDRSLTEGAGLVVDVDPARVDAANEGKLVHVSGEMKAGAPLRDADFGVTAPALRLVRSVEMYQWKEESKSESHKNLGGSEETVTTYSYHLVWDDKRIDSGKFRRPEGHNNPTMRYQRSAQVARDAALGAFRPGAEVIQQLPADQEVPVDAEMANAARGRVGGSLQVADGKFFLGTDPAQPRAGDMRIAFAAAPNGPTSIVGRQAGSDFMEYQTKAGDRLLMARPGTKSAAEMFKQAQDENRVLTWVLRLVGLVLMFIGFALLLKPFVVVADVVPFIGSILSAGASLVALVFTAVLGPLVIAVAWMWYRPLVSVLALAVGAAAAYGFKTLAARRASLRGPTPVAAVSR